MRKAPPSTRVSPGSALAFALGAALTLVPAHASAICGLPPPVQVLPRRLAGPVPRNARVVVTAPAGWRAGRRLVLTTAPRAGERRVTAATTERAWTAGGHERVELALGADLLPGVGYEVQTDAGEILGVFKTGTTRDTTPPTWGGLVTDGVPGPPSRGVVTISGDCGESTLSLVARGPATDDQTPPDDIRYALWATSARSKVDYERPPLTWARVDVALSTRLARSGDPGRFYLSFGSTEEGLNDLELPAERPLRVGVRAVDLAGNASSPSELTIP